jgi:hypothetical protein
MPELPDLNAPEFAPIKARFARDYLEHKADIGTPHATDQEILDHVDDITALMLGALGSGRIVQAPRRAAGCSTTSPPCRSTGDQGSLSAGRLCCSCALRPSSALPNTRSSSRHCSGTRLCCATKKSEKTSSTITNDNNS